MILLNNVFVKNFGFCDKRCSNNAKKKLGKISIIFNATSTMQEHPLLSQFLSEGAADSKQNRCLLR